MVSRRGSARRPTPTDPRMSPVPKLVDVGSIGSYFESLDDPRHTRNRRHLMVDIAVIAVCAGASEQGIALGQVATEAKSNEITAIPRLLEQIDLAGTLITIDAMGCQEIVERIVTGGGDCVIAVKGNQPKLLAAIQTLFLD